MTTDQTRAEALARHFGQQKLTITPTGAATARIEIDGTDISNAVRGLTIGMQAGDLPRVILDLNVYVQPVELPGPQITVPEQTAQALEALGWLPPEKAWAGRTAARTARISATDEAMVRAKIAEGLRESAAGYRRTAKRGGALMYELERRAKILDHHADRITRGDQ